MTATRKKAPSPPPQPVASSSTSKTVLKEGEEPRLSHHRCAVPDNPAIRPYGCNSPQCVSAHTDPPLPGTPLGAQSTGIAFATSKDLLEHLKVVHDMKGKGETPSELWLGKKKGRKTDEGAEEALKNNPHMGEGGKMFRCALRGCSRTWKNANGLQYHVLTSVTATGHGDPPPMRGRPKKRKGSTDPPEEVPKPEIPCPYAKSAGCDKKYKQQAALTAHVNAAHKQATPGTNGTPRVSQPLPPGLQLAYLLPPSLVPPKRLLKPRRSPSPPLIKHPLPSVDVTYVDQQAWQQQLEDLDNEQTGLAQDILTGPSQIMERLERTLDRLELTESASEIPHARTALQKLRNVFEVAGGYSVPVPIEEEEVFHPTGDIPVDLLEHYDVSHNGDIPVKFD